MTTKPTEEKENHIAPVPNYTKLHKPVEKKLFSHNTTSRSTIRQHTEDSLFNFSCVLEAKEELGLSQFEVGRKLGKGRFGDVFMARDIKSGFVIAIKMINKKEVVDAGMESQLTQEIKVQMFANHPNVLKMYGFFADHNKIYLLLELATNGCLFKQIRQKNYFE
jgi:aurora kinase